MENLIIWRVAFLQISLDEIPRHSQLFSWAKTINVKEKWDANVFFFKLNSSCTLSCSLCLNFARSLLIFCLVGSISTSQARSSASASSSSFILTEGDSFNKPVFVSANSRPKYSAICYSINQSVLDNISGRCCLLNFLFGKPHCRRLS